MSEQLSVLPDYDSLWKEILDENFEECIEFFFDLQQQFRAELYEYEEKQRMPYVTSIERLGREEGRVEGRVEGRLEGRVEGRVEGKYQHALETVQRFAKHKFGELGDSIHMALTALKLEDLDALIEALFEMESKQELIDWLKIAKKE